MFASKHFDKLAYAVTALMLAVTILFMNGAALGIEVMAHTMGYENRLFDNSKVHSIDIVMNNWDEFISNATSEEYYTAALVIDGESYKNVAIRGKGNTSLSSVASMGSERYSFKVEFDHYDNSITYHGLDKLSLNNLIQDATMMKDYLSYTMMNEFGAAAPLCSFVNITVNGENWGLYLAVEGVEDSFLERNYGSDYGELYKPDSMSFGGGRGNGKDFDMNEFMNREESSDNSEATQENSNNSQMPNMGGFDPSAMFGGDMSNFDPSAMFGGEMPNMDNFDFSQIPGMTQNEAQSGSDSASKEDRSDRFSFGGMGGFGMGSSDVKLQYIDDNIDSYSNIWNNAKTDITTTDQYRLIESLKKLSNNENLESVVDIEQVIRYFVVHNYVCNGDSYTGSMIHNYYLYEENGQLAMLPWDYNLAYGTFQGGNAQSTVNTPIDAPVSGGAGTDRPMWSWILSDEAYTELYHQYFNEFLSTVDVVGIIDHAYELIKSYVEQDPTAFYSYEEFESAVETLRQFCTLRSESISMQLSNGETTSNMSYVDASSLNLSDMGSMGGGFGGGGMPDMGGKGGFGSRDEANSGTSKDESSNGTNTENTQRPSDFSNFDPSAMFGGNMGGFAPQMPNMENFDPSQFSGGFAGNFGGNFAAPNQNSQDNSGTMAAPENTGSGDNSGNSKRPSRDNMQMPNGDFNFNMNSTANSTGNGNALVLLAVSAVSLLVALIIVKKYHN